MTNVKLKQLTEAFDGFLEKYTFEFFTPSLIGTITHHATQIYMENFILVEKVGVSMGEDNSLVVVILDKEGDYFDVGQCSIVQPETLTEFCGQPPDSFGKYLKDTSKTAFEVEDLNRRQNYVFKHIEEENTVEMWETTNWDNRLLKSFPEENDFPFNCKNSKEYFEMMFRKAIKIDMNNQIVFIGWVSPETFQPIEPKPDEY